MAFSPNGEALAVAGISVSDHSPRIALIDVGMANQTTSLRCNDSFIECIGFSPDSKLLATGAQDGSVTLWELPKQEPHRVLAPHSSIVLCISFSPDGELLATGSDDKTVSITDLRTGLILARLPHPSAINALCFSPDGSQLATASSPYQSSTWHRAEVRVWSLHEILSEKKRGHSSFFLAAGVGGR